MVSTIDLGSSSNRSPFIRDTAAIARRRRVARDFNAQEFAQIKTFKLPPEAGFLERVRFILRRSFDQLCGKSPPLIDEQSELSSSTRCKFYV